MQTPLNRLSASSPVHRFKLLLVTCLALGLGAVSAQPDSDRSLTVDQTGAHPTPTDVAHPPAVSVPTDKLSVPTPDLSGLSREQLEAKIKTLSESLALATSESEFFRKQWQDNILKEQALGIDSLTVNERKLEDRLVQAVKELYQSELKLREEEKLTAQLLNYAETLLKTAPKYDPEVRANYEVASRAAKEMLAGQHQGAMPIATSLTEGQIADINPALNSVVLNLGRSQGVEEGMPFLVFQNGQPVGTLKIVLARELVSAAMVEGLQKDIVLKVGDRAAVAAQR